MIPSLAELDQMHAGGRLPADVGRPLNVAEAAHLVRQLPPARGSGGTPDGYGLLPPQGAEPIVRLRKGTRPAFGRLVPAWSHGMLGAMWSSSSGRVVFRLWFRSDDETELGRIRGPVDVYEDAIASVRGIAGQVPQLTGWQLVRLDGSGQAEDAGGGLLGADGRTA